MNDDLKRQAALAALDYVQSGDVVGVGTGSTVSHFIDALGERKGDIDGAVASSEASAAHLKRVGIRLLDLNTTGSLPIYVDGADETTRHRHLIKGGGGALTREKIIAAASKRFVCIVDESKVVDVLGAFPLPIEVIPMARSHVSRALMQIEGATPERRADTITDNGNEIVDVRNLKILDPVALEAEINQITGVVTCGLFAARPADEVLVASADGVKKLT